MNTETVIVQSKGDRFEIIVQHDESGSAYGMDLSKESYEQLRLHFVVGQSEQLVCDTINYVQCKHWINQIEGCHGCTKMWEQH